MKGMKFLKYAAASLAGLTVFSVSAPAQAPDLQLLSGLQKGSWTLKARGSSESGKRVCLGDPIALTQIQHGKASCSRYVIEDKPNMLRVSYKCGAQGHGVTTIRRESSGLVQVQSQGIANNAPFSFNMEARRTGSC